MKRFDPEVAALLFASDEVGAQAVPDAYAAPLQRRC